MGASQGGERPPLVELGQVAEGWVDGIEAKSLGGAIRLILFKDHELPGGGAERHIQYEALTDLPRIVAMADYLRALAQRLADRVVVGLVN